MDPVALASVVLPVTAVLYGVLAMRTFQERRWWPVAARRAAELVVDPYHAAGGLWLLWDDAQAAAARLLLDGLVTVNRRGNLTLTEAGTDPRVLVGHPVPDSLLAALRRRTAPAPPSATSSCATPHSARCGKTSTPPAASTCAPGCPHNPAGRAASPRLPCGSGWQ
ncbi:hypothetical protein [Streptomyces xanthophaeus]